MLSAFRVHQITKWAREAYIARARAWYHRAFEKNEREARKWERCARKYEQMIRLEAFIIKQGE